MKRVFVALLIISVAVNGLLWKRIAELQRESRSRETSAVEAEALRQRVQELEAKSSAASGPATTSAEIKELARLRNEVGQLRQRLSETSKPAPAALSWRRLPATADWSEKFAAATNALAHNEQYTEMLSSNHDNLISSLANASVEQLEDLKRRAQSRQCISNIKKIGLAARIWANDHGDKFPADFLTMRDELQEAGLPTILFCPAAPGIPQSDWSQLNPAAITYTWHGTTADEQRPESVLTTCPIHGHIGLADGSAQQTRPIPSLR